MILPVNIHNPLCMRLDPCEAGSRDARGTTAKVVTTRVGGLSERGTAPFGVFFLWYFFFTKEKVAKKVEYLSCAPLELPYQNKRNKVPPIHMG